MVKRNLNERNLKIDAPKLCLEWNFTKNSSLPENFFKSSHTKVWWICHKKHEWEASIHARSITGSGCPYCSNRKACKDNCLNTKYPTLSLEWDFIKNDLTPNDVLPNSKKKVWWKCKNNHEWKAWISDRVNGTKCTQCAYGYSLRNREDIYNDDKTKKYCRHCNELLEISNYRLKGSNYKGYWENNSCRQCDSKLVKDYRLTDKGIAAEICRRIKNTCKKESIPFDLDKEWILNKLNSINWKCELTGFELKRRRDNLEHRQTGFQWDSISIDKIEPKLGYIKDNVRFVLNQINIFKQDGSDERMYQLAEALLSFKKGKTNE